MKPFAFASSAPLVALVAFVGAPLPPALANDAPEKLFAPADEAYAAGDFAKAETLLRDLTASRPGDYAFAARALHRLCLGDYLKLIDSDWPETDFPPVLRAKPGDDFDVVWNRLSEYLEEAMLEVGKYAPEGESYGIPPPKILECLWRRRTDYPLTPLENVSTAAAERILTLRSLGRLEAGDPAVIDASILLFFLHKHGKRHLEAAEILDDLVAAKRADVDWLLARARFHAEIRSSRADTLLRELFAVLEHPVRSAEPKVAEAARRAEDLDDPAKQFGAVTPMAAGRGWVGQMVPDPVNRLGEQLGAGLINGLEEAVHLRIQDSLGGEQERILMKRRDGTGSAMAWNVIDYELKKLNPGALDALRRLQEEHCRAYLRNKNSAGLSSREQLALFRKFPWAPSAHSALLEFARKELVAGKEQSAHASYRDLLDHATDESLLKKARVGLWLTLAQAEEFVKLEREIALAEESESFPWMNGEKTAKELAARLLQGASAQPEQTDPSLADLRPRILKLPARSLWPPMKHRNSSGLEFVELQKVGSEVLASTRNALAWYPDAGDGSPSRTLYGNAPSNPSIGRPGPFRPLVHEGLLLLRWGYEADPKRFVAMDAETRSVRWSIDATGPADARRKIPLGNPVRAGGCLYLASGWDNASTRGGYNFRLTCVSASGEVHWNADLPVRRQGIHAHNNSFEAVFGDCLTVSDGKLYCSPGTGFLARFDARDGKLEWSWEYESMSRDVLQEDVQGNAPLLVGNVVVGLPRDTNAVVALDKETGNVLWRSSEPAPRKVLGSRDGIVLLQGESTLAGLELHTGRIIWNLRLPGDAPKHVTLQGDSLYWMDGSVGRRYDAATGIEREVLPLPDTNSEIRNAKVFGNVLYLITDEPETERDNPFARQAPGDALWEIRAENPRVHHPGPNDTDPGALLVHQDETLHCLQSDGSVRWQRFLFPGPAQVHFIPGKCVLLFHRGKTDLHLRALDLRNGNLAWKLNLPRLRAGHGATYFLEGAQLIGRDNSDAFLLVDLERGEVTRRARIVRRNGTAKAGLAENEVQILVAAYAKQLYWLRWDAKTGELAGADHVLTGAHGDPNRPFDDVAHVDAKFGKHACFFVCSQGGIHSSYRAGYADRRVTLLRSNSRDLKFEAPYFLTQEGDAGNQRHRWTVHREDQPGYTHVLELDHDWQRHSTFVNGRLLETIPPRNQQPPRVRIHDLGRKKIVVNHASEAAERMGAVPAGPDRVLVYEYQRGRREFPPYFRLTPYDLHSGQAGASIEIDYWRGSNQPPHEVRAAGSLLLAGDRHTLRAWKLDI